MLIFFLSSLFFLSFYSLSFSLSLIVLSKDVFTLKHTKQTDFSFVFSGLYIIKVFHNFPANSIRFSSSILALTLTLMLNVLLLNLFLFLFKDMHLKVVDATNIERLCFHWHSILSMHVCSCMKETERQRESHNSGLFCWIFFKDM